MRLLLGISAAGEGRGGVAVVPVHSCNHRGNCVQAAAAHSVRHIQKGTTSHKGECTGEPLVRAA